ncbi:uncharacterized protein LY89DRAFT_143305 [Mollisia scopiformis]|uniref:Uncharacterized protein n=1 Tax=Mollisia scopiformis TaxID=149040 RepID=A0A194X308_MOLSC|nr:uncharacterized protein LY89DRAFT_143305 [Mollisia scopiformis]KUJ14568.1 hypothetical protein LY89DRAFT_143305 [Mollisia scopiformis]
MKVLFTVFALVAILAAWVVASRLGHNNSSTLSTSYIPPYNNIGQHLATFQKHQTSGRCYYFINTFTRESCSCGCNCPRSIDWSGFLGLFRCVHSSMLYVAEPFDAKRRWTYMGRKGRKGRAGCRNVDAVRLEGCWMFGIGW